MDDRIADEIDRAREMAARYMTRAEELDAQVVALEASAALHARMMERARDLWMAAHPEGGNSWPDGATNVAWLVGEIARLEGELMAAQAAVCLEGQADGHGPVCEVERERDAFRAECARFQIEVQKWRANADSVAAGYLRPEAECERLRNQLEEHGPPGDDPGPPGEIGPPGERCEDCAGGHPGRPECRYCGYNLVAGEPK